VSTATPNPQDITARRLPIVVDDEAAPLVLPEEFLAYVEILRCVDPTAHATLTRELAAAEQGPAAVEAAAHARRAAMLASLESALASGAADAREPSPTRRTGRAAAGGANG